MRKVFVIGIDGMDADFVADHIDEMPNFRRLRDRGFGGGLRSVFPTDSIPAWLTIFTAIPPVEHGFLDAIDYFKKGHKDFAVDLTTFKGRSTPITRLARLFRSSRRQCSKRATSMVLLNLATLIRSQKLRIASGV